MGTGPESEPESEAESDPETRPTPSREALVDRLGTEAIRFVDTLSDDLATLIAEADRLRFDYLVGDVSLKVTSQTLIWRNPAPLKPSTAERL